MTSTPTRIYGFHEPGGEHLFGAGGGWITFTHELGANPNDMSGFDYRPWDSQGIGCIGRLNHGYGDAGTIPPKDKRLDGAKRVANFVAASPGCSRWIIGNETNHAQERPGGVPITAKEYADYYLQCCMTITARPGHAADEVMPAPVAPWNAQTGHWIDYWREVLDVLRPWGLPNAIAIHAYTHGHDPGKITSNETMDPPNGMWLYQFRHYRQLLGVVSSEQRDIPIYITEADPVGTVDNPNGGWTNANNGWVRNAYAEVNAWNQAHPDQVVHAMCLYRWPVRSDQPQWSIVNRPQVQDDFVGAVAQDYRWTHGEQPPDDDEEEEPVSGLVNGNMVGPFEAEPGHDNILVAYGWKAWWAQEKWPDQDQNSARPLKVGEYKPIFASDYPYRVLEGDTCQCWFVQFGVMNGGIYQQVNVGAGKRVTLAVPFQAWCTDGQDPHVSDGEIYLRAGIDVRGGADWKAESIDWTNWVRGSAEYASTSISTISETDTITVWIQTWNKWALPGHNDIYVDAVTLDIEGEDGDEPGPEPGEGVDYARIRAIIREELDATRLIGG